MALGRKVYCHRMPYYRVAWLSMLTRATFTGPTWAFPARNDGSIECADLDGPQPQDNGSRKGAHLSPSNSICEKKAGKLYWCDREGMRVMRSNLEWWNHRNARRHKRRWGAPHRNGRNQMVRWDQCRSGSWTNLLRTRTRDQIMREGVGSFARRSTLQRVRRRLIGATSSFCFDGLPEPIDLELDPRESAHLLD